MKRGFSLIEMLIVIGIIVILAAVILSAFGGARESAKLTKCQSNLRNLAAAANAYAQGQVVDEDDYKNCCYPNAACANMNEFDFSAAGAWITYARDGSSQAITCLSDDEEIRYALTNGVMWQVVNGNSDVYKCPVHVQTCIDAVGRSPGWSYVMNGSFSGKSPLDPNLRADRLLMFAELPGLDDTKIKPAKFNAQKMPKFSTANSTANDAVLQCETTVAHGGKGASAISGNPESIGFNHVRGKTLVGVVAFADGHTETLVLPKNTDLVKLTTWLCDSYDVFYQNGRYTYDQDSVPEE